MPFSPPPPARYCAHTSMAVSRMRVHTWSGHHRTSVGRHDPGAAPDWLRAIPLQEPHRQDSGCSARVPEVPWSVDERCPKRCSANYIVHTATSGFAGVAYATSRDTARRSRGHRPPKDPREHGHWASVARNVCDHTHQMGWGTSMEMSRCASPAPGASPSAPRRFIQS